MYVKKEYREKDCIGGYGLIIEVRGNPSHVETIIDIIDEGIGKKLNNILDET